ncbi:MAG: hypothetical protein DLM73_06415 [Chthoniobacterales bacterium]|nr:MAG: hypothetical protein DLM73_06415 [Chthoniobacterales bacterium]
MPHFIPKNSRLAGLFIVGLVGFLALLCLQTAPAATITVTGTGDTIAIDGLATFREAITSINNQADVDGDVTLNRVGNYASMVGGTPDVINFNILGAGVKTIAVTGTPEPSIVRPLTINGYSQPLATANTLANSDNALILIELNGTGAGTGGDGLTLGAGSNGSTIKGLVANRFLGNGIVVQSDGNTIVGNFVGTNPAGTARMPNGTFPTSGDGIRIQNASSNFIGGTSPADRNVISGNALDGIHIVGSLTAPATGNTVQGNFVGVAADGKSSVGNRTEPAPATGAAEGNNLFGIEISGGETNTIGGTTAGARNVVGLNASGTEIDNGGQGNTIQGNFSGVGSDGVTPAGNLLHGIDLRSSNGFGAPLGPPQANEPGVSFNLIGGTAAGAGNLVEFNGTGGIAIFGNPVSASGQPNIGNAIEGNSVFENGRSFLSASSAPLPLLGIDLTNGFTFPRDDGFTANDSKGHNAPNDPNNFQNFPVLTAATSNATTTIIVGSLKSAPNSSFRIEFFASDPDPLGLPAEGQQFIGFVNKTTDTNGDASFSVSLNVPVANGRSVTATATDSVGNTSEFSAGIVVPTPAPSPTPTPTATPTPTPTVAPTKALNLATRARVDLGDKVTIGGFIITGNASKKVVVRGLGPSLTRFNLSGLLLDPVLELRQANGALIFKNDNWKDDQRSQIEGGIFQPLDDRESVIFATLAPGAYTATLSGKLQTTGIGEVEVYDNDQEADSQLANISTRGFVQTGDNVMIGGFQLGGGSNNLQIAVRGIGPSLSQFGLSNLLANPVLELRDSNGAVLAANDDWQSDPVSAGNLTAKGLGLQDPKESGIFTSLPPGAFTAILTGASGGTGIGLVEIYNVP